MAQARAHVLHFPPHFPLFAALLCPYRITRSPAALPGSARTALTRSHRTAAEQEQAGGCGPTASPGSRGCPGAGGRGGWDAPIPPAQHRPTCRFPSGPAPPRAAGTAADITTYINLLFLSDRSPSRCLTHPALPTPRPCPVPVAALCCVPRPRGLRAALQPRTVQQSRRASVPPRCPPRARWTKL